MKWVTRERKIEREGGKKKDDKNTTTIKTIK